MILSLENGLMSLLITYCVQIFSSFSFFYFPSFCLISFLSLSFFFYFFLLFYLCSRPSLSLTFFNFRFLLFLFNNLAYYLFLVYFICACYQFFFLPSSNSDNLNLQASCQDSGAQKGKISETRNPKNKKRRKEKNTRNKKKDKEEKKILRKERK